MSTYIEVQNRVNLDYLNRTGFGSETKRAIQAAIRHYERKRWDFNETATSIASSAGQTFVSFPSNFLILDDLRIVLNGEDLPLVRRDAQWLREANAASATGQPTHFAIYQRQANLFVIPDSAYSIPIYYIKHLTLLSADADTNEWIDGTMEDVISYHAAKLMWANVIRNDKEAAKFAALEQTSLKEITSYNEQFHFHKLRSTPF